MSLSSWVVLQRGKREGCDSGAREPLRRELHGVHMQEFGMMEFGVNESRTKESGVSSSGAISMESSAKDPGASSSDVMSKKSGTAAMVTQARKVSATRKIGTARSEQGRRASTCGRLQAVTSTCTRKIIVLQEPGGAAPLLAFSYWAAQVTNSRVCRHL